MKNLSNGTKSGLLIMVFALVMMGVLLLLGQTVPTLCVGLFLAGMVIAIVSALANRRKQTTTK